MDVEKDWWWMARLFDHFPGFALDLMSASKAEIEEIVSGQSGDPEAQLHWCEALRMRLVRYSLYGDGGEPWPPVRLSELVAAVDGILGERLIRRIPIQERFYEEIAKNPEILLKCLINVESGCPALPVFVFGTKQVSFVPDLDGRTVGQTVSLWETEFFILADGRIGGKVALAPVSYLEIDVGIPVPA